MTERDLETVSLPARLDSLAAMWRQVEEEARMKAAAPELTEQARYWAGYADMAERAVQALRGLEDRW